MKECTTANNATLVLNDATFEEAINLQQEIFEQAKKLKIDVGEIEIEQFGSVSSFLNCFKDLFLNLMTSQNFNKIIFQCLKHCTYNDIQITKNLFEDIPDARGDYYEILKECIEYNLSPFMKSLTSQLLTLLPTQIQDTQELNTSEKSIA